MLPKTLRHDCVSNFFTLKYLSDKNGGGGQLCCAHVRNSWQWLESGCAMPHACSVEAICCKYYNFTHISCGLCVKKNPSKWWSGLMLCSSLSFKQCNFSITSSSGCGYYKKLQEWGELQHSCWECVHDGDSCYQATLALLLFVYFLTSGRWLK